MDWFDVGNGREQECGSCSLVKCLYGRCGGYDSPHTKTHLLFQAHFSRVQVLIADYITDTKSVLDQALRIMQVCGASFFFA